MMGGRGQLCGVICLSPFLLAALLPVAWSLHSSLLPVTSYDMTVHGTLSSSTKRLRLGITQAVGGGYQPLHHTISMPRLLDDCLARGGRHAVCLWSSIALCLDPDRQDMLGVACPAVTRWCIGPVS
jgi:hypothetical protein